MHIHILASGSSGNAILFDSGSSRLLIDAGLSCRAIEQRLAALGLRAGDLNAILISHEHSDHIKGLEVLARRYRLPVYARPKTWAAMPNMDRIPSECCRILTANLEFPGIGVEVFRQSHDAAEPVGFCLYTSGRKTVIATDLGHVTPAVEKALAGADLMILEANHDLKMLINGPYPQHLKQRIRSAVGHLSNLQAAQALSRCALSGVTHVFLAHLSQHNNRPDLAEKTVSEYLANQGCDVGREVKLYRTYPDRSVSLSLSGI